MSWNLCFSLNPFQPYFVLISFYSFRRHLRSFILNLSEIQAGSGWGSLGAEQSWLETKKLQVYQWANMKALNL